MASEKTKYVLYGFTVASIVLIMSGCFDKSSLLSKDVNESAQTNNLTVEHKAEPISTSKGHDKKKDLEIASPSSDQITKPATGAASVSQQDKKKEKTESDKNKSDKSAVDKQKYDVSDSFTSSKPTLMGLTTANNMGDVQQKFGDPVNQFTMEDPMAPVTVYEYPGFSIGFNNASMIVFIEINSDQVNPGLNGFRLGQQVSQAIKALGNPDTNTDYVVSYKSEGVILKLDVDPQSRTVRSIKLFDEE